VQPLILREAAHETSGTWTSSDTCQCTCVAPRCREHDNCRSRSRAPVAWENSYSSATAALIARTKVALASLATLSTLKQLHVIYPGTPLKANVELLRSLHQLPTQQDPLLPLLAPRHQLQLAELSAADETSTDVAVLSTLLSSRGCCWRLHRCAELAGAASLSWRRQLHWCNTFNDRTCSCLCLYCAHCAGTCTHFPGQRISGLPFVARVEAVAFRKCRPFIRMLLDQMHLFGCFLLPVSRYQWRCCRSVCCLSVPSPCVCDCRSSR
jgi:hypothetical protein